MYKPLVSVCMPAYNAANYIDAAIRSILDQSYKNWELIIIDDGSTDNTAEIINSYQDDRIIASHQSNEGQSAAANKAFSLSTGELIKFFDADDVLSSGFIESQVIRLENKDDCIASAHWGRFYKDDLQTFMPMKKVEWEECSTIDWLISSFVDAQPMMQCGLWLIPRNILLESGLWDERLSLINDFDFFTRVLLNSKKILMCDALLYYRSGVPHSLSTSRSRKGIESAFLSIDKATSNLLGKENSESASLSCANVWKNFIYEIYPNHQDLIKIANERLAMLKKPSITFPSGGYSKLLLPLVGWKLLKRLQIFKRQKQ
jgi:glycosyltransferase involved in cell wall biosynthesis